MLCKGRTVPFHALEFTSYQNIRLEQYYIIDNKGRIIAAWANVRFQPPLALLYDIHNTKLCFHTKRTVLMLCDRSCQDMLQFSGFFLQRFQLVLAFKYPSWNLESLKGLSMPQRFLLSWACMFSEYDWPGQHDPRYCGLGKSTLIPLDLFKTLFTHEEFWSSSSWLRNVSGLLAMFHIRFECCWKYWTFQSSNWAQRSFSRVMGIFKCAVSIEEIGMPIATKCYIHRDDTKNLEVWRMHQCTLLQTTEDCVLVSGRGTENVFYAFRKLFLVLWKVISPAC